MKKIILFAAIIFSTCIANAQWSRVNNSENSTKETKFAHMVYMGKSSNVYTLLCPESNCLSVNTDLNLIAFTTRTNSSIYAGNRIGTYFSTDGGLSFIDSLMEPWQIPVTDYRARYPSGVIYNPAGNTDPANAYIIATAPMVTSSGYIGSIYASQKFDGSTPDQQYTLYATDTAGGTGFINSNPRYFLQNRGNKIFVLGEANVDAITYFNSFRTIINVGEWQGNSINWTRYSFIPDFALNPHGHPDGFPLAGLAMGDDGQSGYLIEVGRNNDANDLYTFQPIIYKTTDCCQTWTKQNFNWEQLPLVSQIAQTYSPVGRPLFSAPLEAVIDINGNLHFATYVYGAFSDHMDSLGVHAAYPSWKGIIFDIHQTVNGWDAFIIDTVFASDPVDYPFMGMSYTERFQMSCTRDRSKIAYAWIDTDTSLDHSNKYPDLMLRMYNVNTNILYPKTNVTACTEADASAFWMYLGDNIINIGNSLFEIPVSISSHGANDLDSVSHYYLEGIIYEFFIDVPENDFREIICEIFPNPATDKIFINITDNAKLEIINIHGQIKVTKVLTGKMNELDISSLKKGVYIFKISTEKGIVMKKIVKQ